MAQFDHATIGEAHRRAASFEQQSRSSSWSLSANRSRTQEKAGSSTSASKENVEAASSATKPVVQDEQTVRRSTQPNALRCYSCGEQGHRQTACPHANRRGLLLDEALDEPEVYDSQEEHDQDDDIIHPTTGDTGHVLVLRRTCLTPRKHDEKWLPEGRMFALIQSPSTHLPSPKIHQDIITPGKGIVTPCILDCLFATIHVLHSPSVWQDEPCG
ncbi:hypothetical protein Bca52824_046396 [Brassica carinata]|uniref:CCHC-type domain-containing protein n=1 Tax=Brassica carinata TaxID=52824 RepID=A0A8X7REZ7_BRACI|nr:hypothetical protein Bca52824_046396 [Brassica carinata]